jgi:hypothetical protein
MYRGRIGYVTDVGIADNVIVDKSKQCISKPVTVDARRGAKDKNRARCGTNNQRQKVLSMTWLFLA